jgi:hypothetical protein
MKTIKLFEAQMLDPVLDLFPGRSYHRMVQVPLGRKRIDLLCVPKHRRAMSASVELKLKDWRQGLWQASVNLQVADQSFVALWHEFIHRAEKHRDLLDSYGVGLISVGPQGAKIVRRSKGRVYRIARDSKREFYDLLLGQKRGC